MRFDLVDKLGEFAMIVLTGTIAVKLIQAKFSRDGLVRLFKFIAAVVAGVALYKVLPKSPSADLDLGGCVLSGNWTACNGWPIFNDSIAMLSNYVGDALYKIVNFGPTVAGFLAAVYYVMRINTGHFRDEEGIWKTTLGIIAIILLVLYLPWLSAEVNKIFTQIAGLGGEFEKGRQNLSAYIAAVDDYRKASSETSTAIFDLPSMALKAILWLCLFVPSVISAVAYVTQIVVLYGIPFSIFAVTFSRWQDLSVPASLVIRSAGAGIVKGLTWLALANIKVPNFSPSNDAETIAMGATLWDGVPNLLLYAGIFILAAIVLGKWVLGPALKDIFNVRSS